MQFLLTLLLLLHSASPFTSPFLLRSRLHHPLSPVLSPLYLSSPPPLPPPPAPLVGDDSASFSLANESLKSWLTFSAATTAVLAVTSYLWFLPPGPHLGTAYLTFVQTSLLHSTSPALTVATLLLLFAFVHSGLAAIRKPSEALIGPRAHRVIFALLSLPLALSPLSYFINHAHEGAVLWDVTGE